MTRVAIEPSLPILATSFAGECLKLALIAKPPNARDLALVVKIDREVDPFVTGVCHSIHNSD